MRVVGSWFDAKLIIKIDTSKPRPNHPHAARQHEGGAIGTTVHKDT